MVFIHDYVGVLVITCASVTFNISSSITVSRPLVYIDPGLQLEILNLLNDDPW